MAVSVEFDSSIAFVSQLVSAWLPLLRTPKMTKRFLLDVPVTIESKNRSTLWTMIRILLISMIERLNQFDFGSLIQLVKVQIYGIHMFIVVLT